MNFWSSLEGMTLVQLTSADMEAALKKISENSINISHWKEIDALSAQFLISRKDYSLLKKICERKDWNLCIIARKGIIWDIKKIIFRPVLLAGMLLFLMAVLIFPVNVYFIEVEGNHTVPRRQILSAAEECGIRFGASRRAVRSEHMKNALLSAIPELKWAGINTSGCTAIISVKERTTEAENSDISNQVCSIVASKDGIITSCTATRGNLVCHPGQAVSKGQVLISGYTDCGICIQADHAEGEIYAQTSENLEAITPASYLEKGSARGVKRRWSILIGKKRINLWFGSGIYDPSCGRMCKEYVLTLPGGFVLPLTAVADTYSFYDTFPKAVSLNAAEYALCDFAEDYVMRHMIAGSIQTKKESIIPEDGLYRLYGDYSCMEMISKILWEQNGEING